MSTSMSVISKKRLALSVAALAAMQQLAMASGAYADTSSANLTANATVTAECYINDVTMDFGSIDAIGGVTQATATADASGTEPWNCTNGTTGTFAAASDSVVLSAGALGNLTADLSYASAGGAGASATPKTILGTGASSEVSVYGRILVPTAAKAGNYTGTVGLTVTFS